jgi:hypothetical protein
MLSRQYKGRKSLKLERNGWNLPVSAGFNNIISLRLMNRQMYVIVLALGAVVITAASMVSLLQIQSIDAFVFTGEIESNRKAPVAISGENVYVAWWTNSSENNNEEIMFRASTDGGATFSDKINLSNSTNADSWRAEIDSDADSVIVTWWETNQTNDIPVAKVSTDAGQTFGPMLMLATNGTIGGQ